MIALAQEEVHVLDHTYRPVEDHAVGVVCEEFLTCRSACRDRIADPCV